MSVQTLNQVKQEIALGTKIPVGVSNRHVHLSADDLEILFGSGHQLEVLKELSQEGEFAARETVTLVGPRGVLECVRILGPLRRHTQVEISMTDGYRIGLRPPVRDSGDHANTPGIAVVGPKGVVSIKKGVILAGRHLHLSPQEAQALGLDDGQLIKVRSGGERSLVLEQVRVRVKPNYRMELHIDTDEANAALLKSGDQVQLLDPQGAQ